MKKTKQRTGAAVVEFAILAPLLFMLLLGFIELSRGFMVQQVLTNASRVGAREATMLTGTSSGVNSTVNSYVESMGVMGATVAVTPSPESAGSGDQLTVTVTIPYSSVTWLPTPRFMAGKTLTASSVMRKEGFD